MHLRQYPDADPVTRANLDSFVRRAEQHEAAVNLAGKPRATVEGLA